MQQSLNDSIMASPVKESFMSKSTSTHTRVRNIIALTCVAACSMALMNEASLINNKTAIKTIDDQVNIPSIAGLGTNGRFHQSGLGGIHNINHPAGAKARRKMSEANVIIPTSAVPHAVPSLSRENIENLHGHYVHDEHRSPFASFLYNRTKDELEAEQEDYVQRMNKISEEWGAWDFNDEHPEIRPIANFDTIPYKDMMNKDFPEKAWQMDQKYVTDFIAEGRKLVDRVREGIYAEYGHPSKGLSEEEIEARNDLFKIHITEDEKPPAIKDGWAFITKKGLEMYAKKLVHGMMSNDEFYFIMGGHSAAAGHGNNFHQTYMMELANIMEPVMHKLGVRLIVRNLAMGGLGTTHYSLGASTLYGETDVMYWDSGMTEKAAEDQDLFHKQALLGGERVPILLNGAVNNLQVETGDNLWYGSILDTWTAVEDTTSLDQGETLPWAIQYLHCSADQRSLCDGHAGISKYHDSCWITRSDFNPTTTKQNPAGVGGKAGWHPGDKPHKFQGRKLTMLMLKALDEAFNLWELGIQSDGFPLKESYWHVGEIYTQSRTKLSNYLNNDGFNTTACEKRWGSSNPTVKDMGLDRACRISLKGMSEWTPINRGYQNSISKRTKAAPNGYKPHVTAEALYEGVDILPPFWKVPEGHVDVHAIAIASTYAPSESDHAWVDNNADDDAEEAESSRRMLRKAATERLTVNGAFESTAIEVSGDERHLTGDEVVPGQGWVVFEGGSEEVTGYCDGSPMSSDCKRSANRNCLLSGQNDGRTRVSGDSLSGWLIVTVPDVKEGLIFARMEWWSPRRLPHTDGWTEVNNGIAYDQDGGRLLGGKVEDWPDDFFVDIAVNGKIIKTYNYEEMKAKIGEIAYNESYYPLMDDKDVTGDVELGIRLRSEKDPRVASMAVTHIYWA